MPDGSSVGTSADQGVPRRPSVGVVDPTALGRRWVGRGRTDVPDLIQWAHVAIVVSASSPSSRRAGKERGAQWPLPTSRYHIAYRNWALPLFGWADSPIDGPDSAGRARQRTHTPPESTYLGPRCGRQMAIATVKATYSQLFAVKDGGWCFA
ncbi:MAG: hypothetical protein JWR10_3666 [Rubritepida sp.]|nr:hypothetical protein [Rubritepida sp.]